MEGQATTIHEMPAHWEVELRGDGEALGLLARHLGESDPMVLDLEGQFLLRSTLFEFRSDPRDVFAEAKVITARLRGLMCLFDAPGSTVLPGPVLRRHQDGRRDTFLCVDPVIFAVAMPMPILHVIRADGTAEPPNSHPLTMAHRAAATCLHVANVLLLLDEEPPTWNTLFKIFELIQADCGSLLFERGWIAKARAELFCRCAQSPSIAGRESRHALDKHEPPTVHMQIHEATALIRKLARHWVDSKTRS